MDFYTDMWSNTRNFFLYIYREIEIEIEIREREREKVYTTISPPPSRFI